MLIRQNKKTERATLVVRSAFFAVLKGRGAEFFLEELIEIVFCAKADLVGDLGNGQIGLLQKHLRRIQLFVIYQLRKAAAVGCKHDASHLPLAQKHGVCHFACNDPLVHVSIDILLDGVDML